jgi:hypothetical protein
MSRVLIALTAAFALSAASIAFSQSNPSDRSINTNAPASSPQGETPPGMQSAPKGSDKTIRTDGSGTDVLEGTPKNNASDQSKLSALRFDEIV